jgi:hypothetical protein
MWTNNIFSTLENEIDVIKNREGYFAAAVWLSYVCFVLNTTPELADS